MYMEQYRSKHALKIVKKKHFKYIPLKVGTKTVLSNVRSQFHFFLKHSKIMREKEKQWSVPFCYKKDKS